MPSVPPSVFSPPAPGTPAAPGGVHVMAAASPAAPGAVHVVPVAGTAASVTINPSGADNSIIITAKTAGAVGNDIVVEITAAVTQASTGVVVSGNAITVTPGESADKATMTVSGVSTPGVNGSYFYAGRSGLNHEWTKDGLPRGLNWGIPATGRVAIYGAATGYTLATDDEVDISPTFSATAVLAAGPYPPGETPEWPDESAYYAFSVTAGAGVPSVHAATSSAQQVIDAINADPEASALVVASASGTVTGAVAAVAATPLTGGAVGFSHPPSIHTTPTASPGTPPSVFEPPVIP